MSKIVLNDVTNLNALSVINDNFDKLEQELQTKVLYRDNPVGEPNTLENDVDANGNSLYNIQDLTITGNFTVNGKSVEEVIDEATQNIEDNALAAENAAIAAGASAASASASASSATASASTATTGATTATTKASEASSSAASAASSATTATTQAGIATTKASEANTSASNAATSASTATTQAGIATTKAGEASTSATNAATSASSASTSATSAANSAAAAATALDSFDDRYLGTKASDPTLDNDGNALLTGALYYNTTTQTMKVYDGANWIAATAAGTASMSVYKYVATAGQTTFSGAATVGGTMSYTSGNIIVFLNGASLDSTDYTATNGTSVVLASAAALNDELVVVAFKSFTVADTYTKGEVDAFAVKLTGDQTIAGVKTFSGATTVMNGNVGIGTSSPAQKLQVNGAGPVGIRINDTNTNNWDIVNNSYLSFTRGSTETMRIDSSGNLLVATTNPAVGIGDLTTVVGAQLNSIGYVGATRASEAAAYFTRTGTDGRVVHCYKNSSNVGGISVATSSTSFNTSSDYRLKENIAPMTGALAKVAQLKPVTYTWKIDGADGQGFIAHELQEVVPDAVVGEKDAVETYTDDEGNEQTRPVYQGIDTSFLVATLTAAIQEQQALITTLTERITALENK